MKIPNYTPSARHAELAAKRDDLGRKLSETTTAQLALAQNDEPEFSTTVDDAASRRIAELLGQPPAPTPPNKRERLAAMAQEIRDLRSAIELLDRQIEVERNKDEAAYRAGIAPAYRDRQKAVVAAMRQVHAANLDLHELVNAVDAQGVSISSFGSLPLIGSSRDPNGPMARFFRDAIELGVIPRKEMPAELDYR
ncbi:hypothetical protein [Shinella sp. M31]|uniref:hypothetical protein n=1 Tax=Shinella sp. M31 TaxID=3368615 RepID=UPI003BA002B7